MPGQHGIDASFWLNSRRNWAANFKWQKEKALFEEDERIRNSSSIELSDPALRIPCRATHCTCKNVAKTTGDCLEGVDIDSERFDLEVDFFVNIVNFFNSSTVNQIKEEIILEQTIQVWI